jgi:hypothetical protein
MVLNSQNEKFAGFRLLAQIEARIDAVDLLKNKIDDLMINCVPMVSLYYYGFSNLVVLKQ